MYQPYFSKILLIRTGFSFAYIQQQQGHRCSTSDGAANAQAVAVAAATNRARLVAGRGFGHAVRAVGTELGRRLPAQERRPGAQGELQRIGKPLGLAGRPGRRRKTDPISSSGGAVAEAARRRRSNGGHCRPGSLRHEAGGGVGHAVRAVGTELGRRLPAQERRPGAQGELKPNGKPFVLPVTAERGRSRGRKSSAGAAGAQAVAVEEATNRAPA